jgi:hypothetical protein
MVSLRAHSTDSNAPTLNARHPAPSVRNSGERKVTTIKTRPTDDADVRLRVGSAPDSWGVWFPDDEHQLPWHQFLDELVPTQQRKG